MISVPVRRRVTDRALFPDSGLIIEVIMGALAKESTSFSRDKGKGGNASREYSLASFADPLRYQITRPGWADYEADTTFVVVALVSCRNLRWSVEGEEQRKTSCSPGTVFVVSAGVRLSICWPGAIAILSGLIETNTVSDAYDPSDKRNGVIRFLNKQCLQVGRLIREAVDGETETDTHYLDALLTAFARLLSHGASYDRPQHNYVGLSDQACRKIETYLSENFTKPVSVPDMAELLGISSGHFTTCFRRSFGRTPHQYVMALRLDEAERRLRHSDMTIGEVAASLSFSSQSHLTTALQKHRNLTPGELRRRRCTDR